MIDEEVYDRNVFKPVLCQYLEIQSVGIQGLKLICQLESIKQNEVVP